VSAPPHALTALEAAAAIRAGRLSAASLVESCLGRIERHDADIRAWVTVDREGARAEAARLDEEAREGRWRGALHGLPVGLKDIVHVAGLPTAAGARGFADTVPSADAASVARLRQAGAVILGKLHTTEFAYADPAVTRNPWRADRTPGGSSAGSAAAVAARMVPLALGTQTVGSVLRPAAFCGVVGLKPTYGRISRRGVIPLAWSLDHVGILARTVADVAVVLGVLAGHDPVDPGSVDAAPPDLDAVVAGRTPATEPEEVTRAPRLGLVEGPLLDRATPEMRAHLDGVARALAARGAALTRVELPAVIPVLLSAVPVVLYAEAAAYHAERHRYHAARYRPRIRAAVELGRLVSATDYLRAQRVRREAARVMRPLLERVDALVLPPATGPAPDRSTTGDPVFNALASGLGLPAISVPTGLGTDGLPLGLQLVAAPLLEARLLQVARFVEDVAGLRDAPPLG